MFFSRPKALKDKGLLSMNARNVKYIGTYNPRHLFPNVDNKLKTKKLAEKHQIAVPKLLGVIKHQFEVKKIDTILKPLDAFVIKPASGSTGKGILVITGKQASEFFGVDGHSIQLPDIKKHVSNILSGLYSLGGKPDTAMIEALVHFDPVFDQYSYQGVPDIRVIVFQGYPVMAMLRLSTKASKGKANLHQGAVGVGICIATGKSIKAVQFNKHIKKHPDTKIAFDKLAIPHWQNLLRLAASCYELTQLGYIGIDIVLDKQEGPQILELNARPGLAIQIANGKGLAPRLEYIEKETASRSVNERVTFSQQMFSN
ncbi:MAG: alpha-L-glutamate ligase-like protein [Cellvibrionales bacterium]|nr:alpha-L-glutamate ligase-like protein [Cellvibrionales bacterium]